MDEYESPESRQILSGALARIKEIAGSQFLASPDQQRDALNNIRELVETTFEDYRREIGKVQKAELDELRRQAAELK
jgi:uncharacterized protein YbjQ (UPF0145 family)